MSTRLTGTLRQVTSDRLKEERKPAGSWGGQGMLQKGREQSHSALGMCVQHLFFLSCCVGSPSTSRPPENTVLCTTRSSPLTFTPTAGRARRNQNPATRPEVLVFISKRDSVLGGGTGRGREVVGMKSGVPLAPEDSGRPGWGWRLTRLAAAQVRDRPAGLTPQGFWWQLPTSL